MVELTLDLGLVKMSDERGSKTTAVYQMKSYAGTDRINIRSIDKILGVDRNGLTWVLIKQAVR